MESKEIRKKFLEFFEKNGHKIVSSSSLIPDDPSVLLTTAGMQQFKKYYTGEADSLAYFGKVAGVVSVQKCFRASDIDEVGDGTHLTFFEMLGNFSFGGYFKKEAITLAHEFIVSAMHLPISYVTIFKGSNAVPRDDTAAKIWENLGIADIREEGMADVFWGPTGSSGPCGPTTEIYCKNAQGQDVEIWNIVFNEFFFAGSREELLSGTSEKKLARLQTPGVDTGMGLERLAMIAQNKRTIFETDLFGSIKWLDETSLDDKTKRLIIDHLRAAVFLIADGVRPSNKERGYIVRRLLRRVLGHKKFENTSAHPLAPEGSAIPKVLQQHVLNAVVEELIHDYGDLYPELFREAKIIRSIIEEENEKFLKTVDAGIRELKKITDINAKKAFMLYESYGLPIELINDLICKMSGGKVPAISLEAFDKEFKKHQEISRAGQEKKFGGHGLLLDTGELKAADERELKIVTRLHTATHLLQAALRNVLGSEVTQQGSDITAERTRFDFSFPRKLTREEIKKVEDLVNDAIARDYTVEYKEMPYREAQESGALHFFREKYPERVKVYSVLDPKTGEVFSREFCGGPHVGHTGEIGHFRIIKEEASSAGVRRIRAGIVGLD